MEGLRSTPSSFQAKVLSEASWSVRLTRDHLIAVATFSQESVVNEKPWWKVERLFECEGECL